MVDSIFVTNIPGYLFHTVSWQMAIFCSLLPEGSNYIDANLVYEAEMYQNFLERDLRYHLRGIEEAKTIKCV